MVIAPEHPIIDKYKDQINNYEELVNYREEAKKKIKKRDGESELELSDLIASLTIGSNTYNMSNVWDLTYYAFQDQLKRMSWREEFDINTRASLAGAKIDKNKLSHWIKTMSFN